MSKYIIDVGDAYTKHICGKGDMLCLPVRINEFEDNWLNTNIPLTPYTEPDLEQVKKEAYEKGKMDIYIEDIKTINALKKEVDGAYQRGYETAKHKCNIQSEKNMREVGERHYQKGLSDAWEAARKISMAEINGRCSWKSMKNIFGIDIPSKIFKNFTASESIEKLKAYEQEQGAEIKVGNEVKAFEKKPFIVTGFSYGYDEKDVYCHGFVTENGISTSAKKDECVKTGRYFPELAEVLRKMEEK